MLIKSYNKRKNGVRDTQAYNVILYANTYL